MTGNLITLSKRLEAIIQMVSRGYKVCDVGCDHGFTDIALVQRKIAPYSLGMDVRKGPLQIAHEHVLKAGLTDYIELRLSDGLKEYEPSKDNADSLIITGMGGPLINSILAYDLYKSKSFKELILSPQSQIGDTRLFLIENGFKIVDEEMLLEDDKFYTIIKAVPGDSKGNTGDNSTRNDVMLTFEELQFGPALIAKKHEALRQYLKKEYEKNENILCKLKEGLSDNSKEPDVRINERINELEVYKEGIKNTLIMIGES